MRSPSTWGFAATLVVALSSCPYFPEDFIDDTDAGTGGAGGDGGSGGTGGDGGSGGGGASGGNLAPTFDVLPDVTVAEDTGRVTVAVSSLSAGDSSEDALQTVSVTATSDNQALLGTASLGGTSSAPTFSWQPTANGVGAGTITVTATDSLGATFSRTFTLTVTPVNDAPTLETPTARVVSTPATLTIPLVTGPGGGADEAAQTVSVTASANPPTLFASMTASATQLVLVPAATGNGIATLTLTANDGQAANNTRQVSFQVMVNQSPPDITVLAPPGGTLSSCVTLTYAVRDALSLPAALKLEVDDGTGWRPGTLRASEATNVTTSPTGLVHTVTWRSGSDTSTGTVNVRLSAVRGDFAGMSAAATGLTVANGPKFSPAAHFQGGPGTFQAVAVDLNGDGRMDVATPDSFSTSVSVMRGLTDGGFGAPIAYPTTTAMCAGREPKPFSLNVADFNGDGHRDIFVVHENCDTSAVLLSARDGGYLPYQTVTTGINPLFASVADFNLDGKADVAVVNYISNDVSVLLGTGDGGFLPQTRFSTGVNPNKIETADFNGDGRPDVVTADATDDRVSILYGDTDGGLHQRAAFDAGLGVRNLAVGDLNGDGLVDIVGANSGQDNLGSTCAVLYATDAGSFSAPVTYPTQIHPRSATVGDLNGDGKPDFAIGNVNSDSVSVFLSRGTGSFHPAAHLSVGPGPHSVQFVDLNGDGKPEILTGNTGNATFSVLSNQTAVCAP